MEMTPEIKQAFRIAYDAMENAELPAGTNEEKAAAFSKIGQHFTEINRSRKDNPLVGQLLLAVYSYIGECSVKGRGGS